MSATPWLIAGLLAIAVPAAAQQPPDTTSSQPASSPVADQRGRVGTSPDGDAGLWWVPVADTNGSGHWRASVGRATRNTAQGYMNVANFTGAVSYGLGNRADVFLSWDAVTRVDRDSRPLFVTNDTERGGHDVGVPPQSRRRPGSQEVTVIDDLTMLANLPVVDAEAMSDAKAEADKAAAAETMPPPKRKRATKARDTKASRVARRGQDPPAPEKAGQDS